MSRKKDTGIRREVLIQLCALAQRHSLKKLVLFGSRARGDYEKASDIDLAVTGGNVAMFRLDVEDETDTLLTFDVIDMSTVSDGAILHNIETEGIVLYEKI